LRLIETLIPWPRNRAWYSWLQYCDPRFRLMNQPRCGAACRDRLCKGARHQFGRHPPAEGAPDDLAREEVLDRRHKEPALCGRHVGDVSRPDLVGALDREVLSEQVRGDRQPVAGISRLHPERPLALHATQTQLAPHPLDRAEADAEAVGRQLPLQALGAVGLPRPVVRGPRRQFQPLAKARSRRRLPRQPGVVAASGDFEHAAQDTHRVLSVQFSDHLVARNDSLAKYALAFFRMSRSIRNSAFSRRSRESSASASVTSRRGAAGGGD
jgi:hypothetical protein